MVENVLYFDCKWDNEGRLLFQYYVPEHNKYDYLYFTTSNSYNRLADLIKEKILIGYDITRPFTLLLKKNIPVFDLIKDYEDLYLMSVLVFYEDEDFAKTRKLPLDKALKNAGITHNSNNKVNQAFYNLTQNAIEKFKNDVIHLPALYNVLLKRMDTKRKSLYEKIEKPMVKIASLMSNEGLKLDIRKTLQHFTSLANMFKHEEIPPNLRAEMNLCRQLLTSHCASIIYGQYIPISHPTGQIGCKDPNIQLIPRSLRKLFISKYEDGWLVVIDFPQVELKLAALLYSPIMRRLLQQGVDLHTKTSEMLFPFKLTEESRQVAKIVNYGFLYGMGWQAFQKQVAKKTGIKFTDDFAKQLRESWYNFYSDIKAWHDKVAEHLRRYKSYEDETIFYRKLYTTNLNQALYYKIRGSGTDFLKGVLVKFYKDYNVVPAALTYYELVYDVPSYSQALELLNNLVKTINEVWQIIFKVVENTYKTKIEYFPLQINTEKALTKSWGENFKDGTDWDWAEL